MTTFHVGPASRGWGIRRAHAHRARRVYPTKREAVFLARIMMRKRGGELVVHKRNGLVQFRAFY